MNRATLRGLACSPPWVSRHSRSSSLVVLGVRVQAWRRRWVHGGLQKDRLCLCCYPRGKCLCVAVLGRLGGKEVGGGHRSCSWHLMGLRSAPAPAPLIPYREVEEQALHFEEVAWEVVDTLSRGAEYTCSQAQAQGQMGGCCYSYARLGVMETDPVCDEPGGLRAGVSTPQETAARSSRSA